MLPENPMANLRGNQPSQQCVFCGRIHATHAWIEDRRHAAGAHDSGVCGNCVAKQNARALVERMEHRDNAYGPACIHAVATRAWEVRAALLQRGLDGRD